MGDLSIDKSRLSFTDTGIRSNLVSPAALLSGLCVQAENSSTIIAKTAINDFGFKSIVMFNKLQSENYDLNKPR